MVNFSKPVLMGTGLDEKARKELLSKMVKLRETRQKTRDDECRESSTLKQKTEDQIIEGVRGDKAKASKKIQLLISLRLEQGGRARVERVGPRQRGRISNDSSNASNGSGAVKDSSLQE